MTTATRELPPHDIEAEECTIAAMLIDPDQILAVTAVIDNGREFFREKCGWAFDAIVALWQRGSDVNQVTLANELARNDRLVECGGQTWLSDIIRQLPTSIGAQFYAEIVHRDAVYRSLISAAHTVTKLAYSAPPELDRTIARAEEIILGIGNRRSRPMSHSVEQVLMGDAHNGKDALLEEIQEFLEAPQLITGLSTGDDWLDSRTGGYGRSQVIVVMADTSIGKSLWAHWTAREQAIRGVPTLIVSTEMSASEVTNRLVYMQAAVDRLGIRLRGGARQDEKRAVLDAAETVASWPIHIVDVGGITIDGLRSEIRRHHRSHNIEMAIVDHIQQVVAPGQPSESPGAIAATMNTIKAVAMDEYIPVMAIAHVNREAARGKLTIHSGKGGGSIEQVANTLITLEPIRWGIDGWTSIDEDEIAEDVKRDRLDVRVTVAKARGGGGRAYQVRHQSWAQGGRFVESPRAMAGTIR